MTRADEIRERLAAYERQREYLRARRKEWAGDEEVEGRIDAALGNVTEAILRLRNEGRALLP